MWWNNPEHSPAMRAICRFMRARLLDLYPGEAIEDEQIAAALVDRVKGWDKQIAALFDLAAQDDPPYPDPRIRFLEN